MKEQGSDKVTASQPNSKDVTAADKIFSTTPMASATSAPPALEAGTVGASTIETVFPPENLLHGLEGVLKQAAEKAVASSASSSLKPAVLQAAKVISDFSKSCMLRVEEHCNRTRETFIASVHKDLLARMQADIASAQEQLREQLRKQVETSFAEVRAAAQQIEKSAVELPSRLSEADGVLRRATIELQDLSMQVRETAGRAAAEFRDETLRLSSEQLVSLNQRMQATAEAVHERLDTAAARSLVELQAAARTEAEVLAGAARQNVESSLAAVAAEWDARQHTSHEQIAISIQAEIVQFRQRLESILNSSMVTAVAAANEHSRILLDSLLKETVEQLKNSSSETTPR